MSNTGKRIVPAPRRVAMVYGTISVIGVLGVIALLTEGYVPAAVVAAILTAFWLAVTVRALGNGVYSDGYQLVNRNDLGSRRIAWIHIDRFEHRGVKGLGLWNKEDEWMVLQYIPAHGDTATRALTVLEEELRKNQAQQNQA
ncbi:hypothetical protein [Kineosporia sp. NBRC 101731]|uniref:hypothetical protein n=1 Tax=Kineosporia sp. NBRC 101731 TaxID=3032199 RepID=UPI0024A2122A|nr:hypothetical protein [Kineosporia sp. NBRC 101731]GLY30493.1 hypothetical protein Kisp02_38580 [Kineosporia sp. NBRC 101731]